MVQSSYFHGGQIIANLIPLKRYEQETGGGNGISLYLPEWAKHHSYRDNWTIELVHPIWRNQHTNIQIEIVKNFYPREVVDELRSVNPGTSWFSANAGGKQIGLISSIDFESAIYDDYYFLPNENWALHIKLAPVNNLGLALISRLKEEFFKKL